MQEASSLGQAADLAEHRSRQGSRDAQKLAQLDGSQTAQAHVQGVKLNHTIFPGAERPLEYATVWRDDAVRKRR
jgi:hypothetical protein